MKDTVFVALVGYNPIQREGIVSILRKGGFSHLRSYATVSEISEGRLPANKRLICLLDLRRQLDDLPGVVDKLRTKYPQSSVVLLAETSNNAILVQAMECNVDGLFLDKIGRDALIKSLELIVLGEKVFPANNLLDICKRNSEIAATDVDANTRLDMLSSRETEVLQKLTAGFPNKIIARDCGITESTVKVHVKAILRKIRAKNRTQAAVWARKYGIDRKPHLDNPDLTSRSTPSNGEVQEVHDRLSIQPQNEPHKSIHHHNGSKG
ncbi:MAG TPA: response regulator transcription factor [Pseudolabrys sp.]|nr:response regulator transcription factor [Pseudolabrys sp.]